MKITEKDALETLIDCYSMEHLLDSMAEIMRAKAEHIRTNWQASGKAHDRVAGKLERAARSVARVEGI